MFTFRYLEPNLLQNLLIHQTLIELHHMPDFVLSVEDIWCPYAYGITEMVDFRVQEGTIVGNHPVQHPYFKDEG